MVKLPIQAGKWAGFGKKKRSYSFFYSGMSFLFMFVTLRHINELSNKLRKEKLEDLKLEIGGIVHDRESKKQILKVLGIEETN